MGRSARLTGNVHPVGMGDKRNGRIDDLEEGDPTSLLEAVVHLLRSCKQVVPCTLDSLGPIELAGANSTPKGYTYSS